MTPLGAVVAVLAIWWAATHPGAPTTPPANPDCVITQRSDGPVDQHMLDLERKLAEQWCAMHDNSDTITGDEGSKSIA